MDKLAQRLDARIIVPIYPKVPVGHTEVFAKILNLYNIILEGIDSKNIILMGDSCGGNIVLSLIQLIKQHMFIPI